MAPRSRTHRGLEPNLYQSTRHGQTYFRYKHPINGTWHGMGNNKAKANAAARILNAKLLTDGHGYVEKVLGVADKTMSHVVERYRTERVPELGSAAGTLALLHYRLARIEKDLGRRLVANITTQDCAEWLDNSFDRNAYVKHRGTLVKLFQFAQTKGYRPDNPAEPTYAHKQQDKTRQRMTLEQYRALYDYAPHHMKIAMELGLVLLQGRAEVISMKYTDVRDGGLFVVRQKSEKHEHSHLRIELTDQIRDIIQRSREDNIASPYIVHYRPKRIKEAEGRTHWSQFTPREFTNQFKKMRDASGIFNSMPTEARPTFHEIRALGAWLYKKAGFEQQYVQGLMAHATGEMTEHYQSGHEQAWMKVRAELNFADVINGRIKV